MITSLERTLAPAISTSGAAARPPLIVGPSAAKRYVCPSSMERRSFLLIVLSLMSAAYPTECCRARPPPVLLAPMTLMCGVPCICGAAARKAPPPRLGWSKAHKGAGKEGVPVTSITPSHWQAPPRPPPQRWRCRLVHAGCLRSQIVAISPRLFFICFSWLSRASNFSSTI